MSSRELMLENLNVTWLRPDVASIKLDMPNKSANVINDALQVDIGQALDFLSSFTSVRGAVLSSAKEKIFVAGADLTAIVRTLDWPSQKIHEFCNRGQRLFNRFQEMPFITVAAIHGACVGGGLELALGCNFLIASNDKRTILGLPETKLGLIPGWAGTVRLPRLLGLEPAIDLIADSKLFDAKRAKDLNLVHQVVDPAQLMDAAITLIEDPDSVALSHAKKAAQHSPCRISLEDRLKLSEKWSTLQADDSGIHPFAKKVLAQHMIRSAEMGFDDACESEAMAMAQVYGSPSSRGLLNNFFLNEHIKKNPGWLGPSSDKSLQPIKSVGIVGAGVMGQSIALSAAKAKSVVRIFDHNIDMARTFAQENNLEGLESVDTLNKLLPVDLVLECVSETLSIKRQVMQSLYSSANSRTIFASNTSAISIQAIFSGLPCGDRCLGIHYCHPELLQLVEIVRTASSSDATIQLAVDWVRAQKKTPLVVADSPGFVVNRILTAMIDSAIALVEEGNSFQKIDHCMQEFGFLGGPFQFIDTIGLDTVVNAGRAIVSQGIRQVANSPILPMMLKKKRLGRKTRIGFYRYADLSAQAENDDEVQAMLQPYQKGSSQLRSQEIRSRILTTMLIAACDVLDRNVVANPRDIDVAMIQGLSFPSHEGGLLFWADQQSREEFGEAAMWVMQRQRNLCLPIRFVDWQKNDSRFYSTIEV